MAPSSNNIPFSFDISGYSALNSNTINFSFGLRPIFQQTAELNSIIKVFAPASEDLSSTIASNLTRQSSDIHGKLRIFDTTISNLLGRVNIGVLWSATSDLQSAIKIMQLYQDSTYTYIKDCPTVIVGYATNGLQILKLPCVYGGVRDIGTQLYGNPRHNDLQSILRVFTDANVSSYIKSTIPSSSGIFNILKGWGTNSLEIVSVIRGWSVGNTSDFYSYTKQTWPQYLDITSYLKDSIVQSANLRHILKGWVYESPRNLSSLLKGWAREATLDIPSYLKQTWQQTSDIPSYLKDFRNQVLELPYSLHGWQEENLPVFIGAMHYASLGGSLYSRYTMAVNIPVLILAIPHKNISSAILGWAIKDLNQNLVGVYGPYDLQSSVQITPHVDLPAYLGGFNGVSISRDLRSRVTSYNQLDLTSIIDTIGYVDLLSSLTSTGKSLDLPSSAYPKIISVKSYVAISLLAHRNLLGYINQGCFGTGYRDLYSSVHVQHAKDLRAALFIWRPGTIVNLTSYINADSYLVQDTISITLSKNPHKTAKITVSLNISGPKYTYDTFSVITGNSSYRSFTSSITGLHLYRDLAGTITAAADTSYYVDNDRPISHKGNTNQTVLKLTGGKEDWRREVEILFRSAAQRYYYLSHAGKVAKYEEETKWSFIVTGFDRVTDGEFDRAKARSHYLVDLRKYDTVDAALRDLIDRVSLYRESNLGSYLNASGGFRNLPGHTKYIGSYKSYKDIINYILPKQLSASDVLGYARTFYREANNLNELLRGISRGNIANFSSSLTVLTPPIRVGLLGEWLFNGNANDMSVNSNHGAVTGATVANDSDGNPNSAYDFDGSGDGITMLEGHTFPTEGTIAFKFTANNWTSDENAFSNNTASDSEDSSCRLAQAKSTKAEFILSNSGGSSSLVATSFDLSDGTTYLMVLTWSTINNRMTIYIDGSFDNDMSGTVYCPATFTDFNFGGGIASPGSDFDGKIDWAKMWTRELDFSEATSVTEAPY